MFAACGIAGSSSVRAIRIANAAPLAPEMNHLCPFTTHVSPSRTARVWMSVGSEPATSGSVIAKHERTMPSQRGRRYFSFCASVAQWSRVCMLPSSGACAFSAYGPNADFAASAETAAIATCPTPMPPNSFGMCGSQSPQSFAATRISMMFSTRNRRSFSRSAIFASRGRTTSVTNFRTFKPELVDLGRKGEVDGHESLLYSSSEDIAREVRRSKDRPRRRRKALRRLVEPDDARVPHRDAAAAALDLAAVRAHEVPRPVHVAAVGHRDHEARGAPEGDDGRAVAVAAAAADVMHDGERGDEPGDRAEDVVREHPVHAAHDAWEVHAARP